MKNTIIIMTSNLITDTTIPESSLRKELTKYFRIEFLNRIDDIVLYAPLGESEISHIVELLLSDVTKKLSEKNIIVTWDVSITEKIAALGYDSELGARPLKRAITEYVINPLSRKILAGELSDGDNISISLDSENQIIIEKR